MHGENIKSRNQIVYALCNEPGGSDIDSDRRKSDDN